MSVRRSRRSAAAAAESRIARVVEDDSDDSNVSSNFDDSRRQSSVSDNDDESISSGNESDADFEISRSNQKGRKTGQSVSNNKNTSTNGGRDKDASNSSQSRSASSASSNGTSDAPQNSSSTNNTMAALSDGPIFKDLDNTTLKSLMRNFRLSDLQHLMAYSGKNRAGRKTDLLERACDLVEQTNGDIKKRLSEKIQELSHSMFKNMANAPSVNPYSATYQPPSTTSSSSGYNSSTTTSNSSSVNSSNSSYLPLNLSSSSNQPIVVPPPTIRYEPEYAAASQYNYRDTSHLMYPTYPDVKLRTLPFYKIEAVLMKPSSLQPRGLARFQEQNFSFHLTPTQANEIEMGSFRDNYSKQDFKKQIQLRFSLLETSCEQDDNFPASVCVKVNGRLQTLPNPIPTNKPGVEPKRPPKPINITGLCKLSSTVPNYVNVTWAVEVGSGFTTSVYFVDKLSSTDLMEELKKKGKRHSDYTRALIKDKLSDNDNEIATTSCKVSLACPLGKMRMSTPCRASTCDHLQCFDANLYLMMNEKKPKWMCPVCNKAALYENLLIDGYFTDVLTSQRLPHDEHEIVLNSDASWDPLVPTKKNEEGTGGSSASEKAAARPPSPAQERMKKAANVETLSLDDDDDEPIASTSGAGSSIPAPTPPVEKSKPKEVTYVTLDSDDDVQEEIIPPPAKRSRFAMSSDDNSDSVSALTPTSISPTLSLKNNTPYCASAGGSGQTLVGNGSLGAGSSGNPYSIPPLPPINNGPPASPEIICLDDD